MLKFVLNMLMANFVMGYEVHVNRKSPPNSVNEVVYQGEYETTIYLGTPSQEVGKMILDTGSSMPWVKNLDWYEGPEAMPGVKPVYNSSLSSTFNETKGDYT
jgi:hypothetical protein